jgi:hypothetical protein
MKSDVIHGIIGPGCYYVCSIRTVPIYDEGVCLRGFLLVEGPTPRITFLDGRTR